MAEDVLHGSARANDPKPFQQEQASCLLLVLEGAVYDDEWSSPPQTSARMSGEGALREECSIRDERHLDRMLLTFSLDKLIALHEPQLIGMPLICIFPSCKTFPTNLLERGGNIAQ